MEFLLLSYKRFCTVTSNFLEWLSIRYIVLRSMRKGSILRWNSLVEQNWLVTQCKNYTYLRKLDNPCRFVNPCKSPKEGMQLRVMLIHTARDRDNYRDRYWDREQWVSILHYVLYTTGTGTGNHCFLLYPSRSLSLYQSWSLSMSWSRSIMNRYWSILELIDLNSCQLYTQNERFVKMATRNKKNYWPKVLSIRHYTGFVQKCV